MNLVSEYKYLAIYEEYRLLVTLQNLLNYIFFLVLDNFNYIR